MIFSSDLHRTYIMPGCYCRMSLEACTALLADDHAELPSTSKQDMPFEYDHKIMLSSTDQLA